MPEGFSSVADLKVVVDANTDKFSAGISGVRGALASLKTEGDSNLGGLDKALSFVGDAAVGVKGKIALFTAAVESGVAIYKQFASEGRAVAEAFGVTAEFDRLTSTIDDLGMSIQDGAVQGFFALQAGLTASSGEMMTFASSTGTAEDSAESFAGTLLNSVADSLDVVRLKLRLFNADAATNSGQIDTTLEILNRRLAQLTDERRKIEASGETVIPHGWFGSTDRLKPLIAEIENLTAARDKLTAQRSALPGQDWIDGTTVHTSLLGDNISRLEQQRAALGLAAGAAAAYAAEQDAINKLVAQGVEITDERLVQIRQEAAQIGALTTAIDGIKKAQADQKQEEARGLQIGRAQDNAVAGGERELGNLRVRAQSFGMAAEAAGRLAFEERILAQLRASGGAIDEADIVKVRAMGEEYQRLAEDISAAQETSQTFGEINRAMSATVMSAFRDFADDGKVSMDSLKDSLGQLLQKIAELALQKYVLDAIFGGGTGGSGGAGLLGSAIAGAFGGFRENGGPVEAGRAYVVGERRPELFIPNQSGRIEPSVGGAGGEVIVSVRASPELYAEIDNRAEGVVTRRQPAIVGAALKTTKSALPGMLNDAQKRTI
jgi:hypothetical protein